MGGPGSGGRRAGAGRKTKAPHLRAIDGGAGRRGQAPDLPEVPPAAESDKPTAIEPPADLRPEALAVWQELAPEAIAAKTLATSTRVAFRDLCELVADCRELRARIAPRRSATGELMPLLVMNRKEEHATRRLIQGLAKDVRSAMKDFKLAPFGKELDDAGDRQAEADPLDAFTRRRG